MSTVMPGGRRSGSTGTVSVTTMPPRSAAAKRSSASPEKSPWVAKTQTSRAPASLSAARALEQRVAARDVVVADDRDLPLDLARDLRHRGHVVRRTRLVHDREVGSDHLREAHRVLRASRIGSDRHDAIADRARGRGSTARTAAAPSCGRPGIVKKPWIWPACRSIVSTRSAPASWSMSASEAARDRLPRLRLSVLPRVREPAA